MEWRRRDILDRFAGLMTVAAVLGASWPIMRRPRPGILDFLAFGTVGSAGGLLAVVVFAVAAGREPLNPFGRAKPGWVREMTFLHAAYFAGAAAFAFAVAADTSGWMWPYGTFWAAMAVWRVRAGWRAGSL